MDVSNNAGEASMEEILASIRKIIAEEPGGAAHAHDDAAVNPLLSGTELKSDRAEAAPPVSKVRPPPPSLDRLSEALRANANGAALSGAKKISRLDDDLADLIGDAPPAPIDAASMTTPLAPPSPAAS